MCGRFNMTASEKELSKHFQLLGLPQYEISYNIPPGQKILNIVKLNDISHKAVNLWWGLIPSWSKDRKISHQLFNARAETANLKPSFRNAFKKRRCLIPATGYYEWQKNETGKQAFHIDREDQQIFAFAGLWEYWENENQTLYSCTIITRESPPVLQTIHDRMPLILEQNDYADWLDKKSTFTDMNHFLENSVVQGLRASPVSDWVNNPAHNDSNCLV